MNKVKAICIKCEHCLDDRNWFNKLNSYFEKRHEYNYRCKKNLSDLVEQGEDFITGENLEPVYCLCISLNSDGECKSFEPK